MKHVIILDENNDDDFLEDYEKDDDNICEILVSNEKQEDITKKCKVQLNISKNALIGLGTEMIRMAYKFKEGKHFHIPPIKDKENIYQVMGVVLTPDSCELIVCCTENGTIDKHTKDL